MLLPSTIHYVHLTLEQNLGPIHFRKLFQIGPIYALLKFLLFISMRTSGI